jgi:pyridoxine 4-dehydrogenase
MSHCVFAVLIFSGVIPLGGARDAKQAEQNAGALGWRLSNEEVKELESHHVNPNLSLFNRLWQHG